MGGPPHASCSPPDLLSCSIKLEAWAFAWCRQQWPVLLPVAAQGISGQLALAAQDAGCCASQPAQHGRSSHGASQPWQANR